MPHLAGRLGELVLTGSIEQEWIRVMPRGRAVQLTDEGRRAFVDASILPDSSAVA